MTDTGNIQVSAYCTANLLTTPMPDLARFAHQSWEETAILLDTKRYKLCGFPAPDVDRTWKVLNKFRPAAQRLMLQEICKTFQTERVKAKWDPSCDGLCPHCHEEDTMEHRYLTCNAFAEIRDEHPHAIHLLQDEMPGWQLFPVAFRHEMFELVQATQARIPEVEVAPELLDTLDNLPGPLQLFTDGSCEHPECPKTRYAAYSVVADIALHDAMRCEQACIFQATGKSPPTFVTLLHGRLPGVQSIHRAEIFAIVLACESFREFDLYTDSLVAFRLFHKLRLATDLSAFRGHFAYDLLQRWHPAIRDTQRVHKIKSHGNLAAIPQLLTLYKALGNQAADDAAGAANHDLMPALGTMFSQMHKECDFLDKGLEVVYHYLIDLQKARAAALAATRVYESGEPVRRDPVALLSSWQPQEAWTAPGRIQCAGIRWCAWGWQPAAACLKWLRTCTWPLHEIGPGGEVYGLSYAEIAIAISLEMGCYLPVKRTTATGDVLVVYVEDYAAAKRLHVTMQEQIATAHHLLTQVLDLIPERMIPDTPKGHVRSLYALGDTGFTGGLMLRPAFTRQSEVIQHTKWYIENSRDLPALHFQQETQQWPFDVAKSAMDWTERILQSRPILQQVRRVRSSSPTE